MKLIPFIVLNLYIGGISASAQHFDPGIVHVLNKVNNQSLISNSSKDICLSFSGNTNSFEIKEIDQRTLNDCVVSLCGLPSENESAYVTDLNFDAYVSPTIKRQLDTLSPKLNKAFDKIQKNNLRKAHALEENLLKEDKLDLRPKEWSDSFKSKISFELFTPYITTVIDLKKPLYERVSVIINSDKELTPEFRKNLITFASDYEKFIKYNSFEFQTKGLYSESEKIQIVLDKIKNLRKTIESHLESFTNYELEYFKNNLDKIENDIKDNKQIEMPLTFLTLDTVERSIISKDPSIENNLLPPACSDNDSCKNIFQEHFSKENISEWIKNYKKSLNDPTAKEHSLNRCKAQIVSDLSNSSNEVLAEKLMLDTKSKMDQNVFSKFSAHSKKILKSYFSTRIRRKSKKLTIFSTSEDPAKNFQQKIDTYLSEQSGAVESLKQQENSLTMAIAMSKNEELDPFFDETSPCFDDQTLNAWDMYLARDKMGLLPPDKISWFDRLSSSDHIYISAFSSQHELRGKSIVAHELGHAVNHIFASIKLSEESARYYKTLRQCVTDNYVNFNQSPSMFSLPGDRVTTEEDMADIFAFMTYNNKDDLFICSLIRPSRDNKSYANLEFISNDGDSHSTSLYRLIMEAINKDVDLPISCQKAIEPMKDQLRFKKCAP